jgi:nucleoside-diphosphate-sugar epimerase
MKALIIGGTGLISRGIVKHLLARGAEVTQFNRSKRENPFGDRVETVVGDRNEAGALAGIVEGRVFDVVIDMIGFTPAQAEADVAAFAGKCGHFIFCSTVCTYGVKVPPGVFVDEAFPQEPISEYGRNKVACERILMAAHEAGRMKVTIVRPSCTYGPSGTLIDQSEFDPVAWDRVERGLPVLCAGDGLGLWQATHRDDVGKLFAYAAMNPATFGEDYNAVRDEVVTWEEFYRQVGAALGKPVELVYAPAEWIVRHDPKRFGLLKEITRYHGAYSSAKAKRDVPEFDCPKIDLVTGARETLADVRRRGAWKKSEGDALYEGMVEKVLAMRA